MILTLEQWEGILTAVSQDEGDILKAIKEKLNEKYRDTCQEREFDANHLFDVSLTINNIQYNVKFPLLHIVSINGHLEIIKHLIEKGANVDEKTNNRLTPLCLAVLTGHKDVVTAPLEKGANIDEKEADKWTPLHFAAINGHLEIVKHLIEKGANVDRKAINGFTPLHLATRYGHKEVITTLLGKGANVNEKTADGWTSLCLAALTGHKDVVTTLLEKRANPLIRNKDGETPRNLANDENIIQLLKDAETKQIISKAIKIGATLSIITALTVGIGCGISGVELSVLAIVGIAVAAALVIGIIAGGISHVVLKPSVVNSPKSQNKVQSQISDQESKITIPQHLAEENLKESVSKTDANSKLTENSPKPNVVQQNTKPGSYFKFNDNKLLFFTTNENYKVLEEKCKNEDGNGKVIPGEFRIFVECGSDKFCITGPHSSCQDVDDGKKSVSITSVRKQNVEGTVSKDPLEMMYKVGLDKNKKLVEITRMSINPFKTTTPNLNATTAQQTVNNTTIDQPTSSVVLNKSQGNNIVINGIFIPEGAKLKYFPELSNFLSKASLEREKLFCKVVPNSSLFQSREERLAINGQSIDAQ